MAGQLPLLSLVIQKLFCTMISKYPLPLLTLVYIILLTVVKPAYSYCQKLPLPATEIRAGNAIHVMPGAYRYFLLHDNTHVAIPVKGGYSRDGILLGVYQHIPLSTKWSLVPGISGMYIANADMELADTTIRRKLFSVPVVCQVVRKFSTGKNSSMTHEASAGAGANITRISAEERYQEKGKLVYNISYAMVYKPLNAGVGLSYNWISNEVTQQYMYKNQLYTFSYTAQRNYLLLYLFKRI